MSLIPHDLIADFSLWLGGRRVAQAERYQSLADGCLARGRKWLDVATWMRGRCAKPLAEVTAEREAQNG